LIKKTCKEETRRRLNSKGEDNIIMGLVEVGCGCVEKIYLTDDGVQ
jgi:hypothetical protein